MRGAMKRAPYESPKLKEFFEETLEGQLYCVDGEILWDGSTRQDCEYGTAAQGFCANGGMAQGHCIGGGAV